MNKQNAKERIIFTKLFSTSDKEQLLYYDEPTGPFNRHLLEAIFHKMLKDGVLVDGNYEGFRQSWNDFAEQRRRDNEELQTQFANQDST